MNDLIEIYKMTEVSQKTRARLIIKMGNLINDQYGANLTEAVVYELVGLLDPENAILQDDHYKSAR